MVVTLFWLAIGAHIVAWAWLAWWHSSYTPGHVLTSATSAATGPFMSAGSICGNYKSEDDKLPTW